MKKLSLATDIYSIGVIIFKCLIGITPPEELFEAFNELPESNLPDNHFYETPKILNDYVLSDQMC